MAKIWNKVLATSEMFEELLSWNLKSKLITPKYITGTYFDAMATIFEVMIYEQAPKAGPCYLFIYDWFVCLLIFL